MNTIARIPTLLIELCVWIIFGIAGIVYDVAKAGILFGDMARRAFGRVGRLLKVGWLFVRVFGVTLWKTAIVGTKATVPKS